MKRRDIINIIIFAVIITYAAISYYYGSKQYSQTEFLMDTIVNIKVKSRDKAAEETLVEAFDVMRSLEKKLSCYQENGLIWNFNNDIMDSLIIDNDLQEILTVSNDLFVKTDSLYEITIGRLTELWDFEEEIIPRLEEIEKAKESVGFDKLEMIDGILRKPAGMKINLGSLAKGFIIDRTVEFLQEKGIKSGFVNAGGDIRIFGQKKPLRIGIQHPRSDRGELAGTLNMTDGAIVTSGDYERFFILDGVRYHHILNPATGYPAENAVSVTVIAEEAILADAYSTALFLLEPQQAIILADEIPELEAKIFYLDDDKLKSLQSNGMKEYLE